jgi:hypothetical protein
MASLIRRRGVLPWLLLVALASVYVDPAGAQATGSLELVAQSAWVDDGGIYNIQVRVAGADPDSSVVMRVYPPWPERDDFLRFELGDQEPVLVLEAVTLGDLQVASNEVLALQLAVVGPNTPPPDVDPAIDDDETDAPLDVLVTDGGSAVHPIEIVLLDPEGNVADSFLTSLVELPRAERNAPLRTTLILESHLPLGTASDGSSSLDLETTSDLATIVDAVANHPSADIALSVLPESLVSIERSEDPDLTQLLDLMRSNLESDQLLPNPYVDVEEQAWVDAELTDALASLYVAGAEATTEVLGLTPEPAVMLLDRTINAEGLDALAEIGVQGAIVRPAQLETLDREVFPQALTTRFLIPTADGRSVPALVADGGLSNHFTNAGGTVLNANRLLADLTLLSLQNSDVRQAVVVLPPEDWVPDATFLNVVLSGMERIPAIRGASPLDALSSTAFTPAQGIGTLSPPLRRELLPRRLPRDLGSFRTEYNQARAAIDSWSSVIADDGTSRGRLDELLRLSTDTRHDSAQRTSYIDAIYSLIEEQKSSSITTPESETITLTGRFSDVPIVVENNLPVNASVVLLLDSEKLAFPNGSELPVVLVPGPNRIDVAIEARASGDSPIRIQVLSPDRSILLGSSEVLVRTFAFSGVGVIIGISAIVVLLLWWLRHLRSSRDTVETLPDSPTSAPTEESLGV